MIEQIIKRGQFLETELKDYGIIQVPELSENYSCGDIDAVGAANAIDHTILSFNATENDIIRVCEEAGMNGFKAICINPLWIKSACDFKKNKGYSFLIATVVDFPLGASSLKSRIAQTEQAVADGADEIDIVINIGLLKSGKVKETFLNLKNVICECRSYYKVILETSELSIKEKIDAALISVYAGADMLKTSTGVNGKAAIDDVKLLRMIAGKRLGVKAAGGIRDKASLIAMMNAGADRIGCSSSVNIINNW